MDNYLTNYTGGPIQQRLIKLGSAVKIRDFYGRNITSFRFVIPEQADTESYLFSIDSPIGTALLGMKEGDIFDFQVASGAIKKFLIIEVK